jgi:protein TonB
MKDGARWTGSFALVLAAHAAAIGAALGWAEATAPYSPPPAAMMLELAPMPAAPETTPNDAPPAPDFREAIPEPEEPPPVDIKPMTITLPDAELPPPVEIPPPEAVVINLPPPEPPPPVDLKPPPKPKPRPVEKPKPKPKERKPPAQAAAPQTTPDQAARAVAPTQGASPAPPSAALPTWKGLLLRHLERHKRYPSEAQRQRQEGVVYVRFTLSRDGRVIASRMERASGNASLDREGLELLQRAQPMPPFPPDQPGESMELIVPVQFSLRR